MDVPVGGQPKKKKNPDEFTACYDATGTRLILQLGSSFVGFLAVQNFLKWESIRI